jgi:phosphoglucosamine mutase
MYKEQGWLKNNLVISTVLSNFGLSRALRDLGINHATCRVGDRYVLEMMREKGAILGGEPSGHMIFLDHHTAGDGIITALQLLRAMRLYGMPLSELSRIMKATPQVSVDVEVKTKPPLERISELQRAIRSAEEKLQGNGRVLVRYSGTQSLCRVMVEGSSKELAALLAGSLADVIKESIG